jgi:membrane protein DedA with SNARE-associated domain
MDLGSYTILFAGVAASWVGIPIVGGAVLAGAGVLAGEGQLDIWLVIAVAALAAWTGGYLGYLLGARAGQALAVREGRWHRQRQRAMRTGERFYRRWGPLAVFLTPTWVAGALRMPRNSFLVWNAMAAIISSLVAVFGAYAIARAILGQALGSAGLVGLAAVGFGAAACGLLLYRRHRRSRGE